MSVGPWEGLNLSLFCGDRPEHVEANTGAVADALGIPAQWARVRQVHGARAVKAERPAAKVGRVATEVEAAVPDELTSREADAIVVSDSHLPAAVLTADCVPIALVGESSSAVVHAGWRGMCAGVIQSAVDAMQEPYPRAWIGPCIGPCHYVVGPELVERFDSSYAGSPDFCESAGGQLRFDLRAAARWLLRRAGAVVGDEDPPCTACETRFYSHRRDGATGRQAVLVWR
ncbi:MAG: polyphenol oxidase family protein [Actinomycetota bacterium]|nr:polyphenol oxidase family protein [Actinomycetota bacterium]